MVFWDVAPAAHRRLRGKHERNAADSDVPGRLLAKIPNQILWLNGTSGGLVTTAYEAAAPGRGNSFR